MTIHIGISGPIASGKSTLAKFMREIFILMGKKASVQSFASGVYYLAYQTSQEAIVKYFTNLGYDQLTSYRAALGVLEAQMTYPIKRDENDIELEKPRRLLQTIGTEVGRDTVDKDVWIKAVQSRMEGSDIVISDDVRFMNESEAVDFHIRIEPGVNNLLYLAYKAQYTDHYIYDNHASEKQDLKKPNSVLQFVPDPTSVIYLARRIIDQFEPKPVKTGIQGFSNALDHASSVMGSISYPVPVIASGVYDATLRLDHYMYPESYRDEAPKTVWDKDRFKTEEPKRYGTRKLEPKLDPEELG